MCFSAQGRRVRPPHLPPSVRPGARPLRSPGSPTAGDCLIPTRCPGDSGWKCLTASNPPIPATSRIRCAALRQQVWTCRTPGPTLSNAFSPGKATRAPPQPKIRPHVRGPGAEAQTLAPWGALPEVARRRSQAGASARGSGAGRRRPLGLENKLAIIGSPGLGTPGSPRPASSQGADKRGAVRCRGSGAAEGRAVAERE